jgi:photosystem II stability/assembly factor-like uncharacterized protein
MPNASVVPVRRPRLAPLAALLAALLPLALPAQGTRSPSKGASAVPAASAAPDSATLAALSWRNIGPWRGGRANAVAGLPSNPLVFFAGYTGGGVWRTDNAGISWRNISDGFFTSGSIGAIAVAPSDEHVLYVATGEHAIRGQSSSYGDGVYKSTDQGRSWKKLGLAGTRQVSAVRVHPRNPDVVYVAAQGDRWKGSAERGIYRSTDGGATWALVLAGTNATSGASDLSMDPANPRILYAAFWDHQRMPWMVRSGGPGSGIWKSTDGGDSWTRLTEGLPSLMGKVGVAVSPANPDRLFAIVEAEPGGGLYRSDDAGKSWRLQSGDRLIQTRSWYYMKVTADPANADVVWVMNAPVLKSIDGGRTFAAVRATHGDNHQLWISPRDSRVLANANDGGVSVSLDGGASWSTQDNQPTAQFYHAAVDDGWPYKVYGGQQDNSSVIIASRSDRGSIGVRDWQDGPGCESANMGVSARNPRFVYGGCYQGLIDELDQGTGLSRTIMPWPEMNLTEPTDKTKYRFNWTAPIEVSQHDDRVVYHGGNVLFRTTDRGARWTPISGDLTRNDKARQGWGGAPITNEGAGGEVYGTIVVIEESPHDAKTLYVGTDDGLVQRTRDGGATWTNVTPAAWGDGLVNEIAVSPHDPATVTVAFRKDRVGDPTPHLFRSTDHGATWTRLVTGLREGEPVRVVREDPERKGLLYAGTETGVYVSFDAGARWQPMRGALPVVPVTDLQVKHGDLVASTEGRAFWILDDLSVLRQHADSLATVAAHLYAPRPAVMAAGGGGFGAPAAEGRNPPAGATLFVRLAATPDSATTVTLEIRDAAGAVVRSFASRGDSLNPLRLKAGLNPVNWNLRRAAPTRLPNVMLFGAPGDGPMVLAGRYTVRLTWKGGAATVVREQPLEVRPDPRQGAVPAAVLAERDSLARLLAGRVDEIHKAVLQVRDLRTQVQGYVTRAGGTAAADTVAKAGRALAAKLQGLDPRLTTKAGNGQDIINYANGINGQYGFLWGQVEGNDGVISSVRERLVELEVKWRELRTEVERVTGAEVEAFNALLKANGVPGVIGAKKGPIA